ncbi:ABC transporter substrate-binding protein [Motiliproteus sp. SC1-56]|uniref:ABC transporter substrate-binding protein n=1 Tax=Motiliproteus sp. SC1-56 TaxID=2799565 RepID=UPI001A8CDC78|nr:hypothetical protein [Motiliproteus sp. SC1-56]
MIKLHRASRGRCLLALWLLLVLPVQAMAARLLLLPSEDQPLYRQLVEALTVELGDDSDWSWRVLDADAELSASGLEQVDLLITLGTRATRRALAVPERPPTLSVFIPRNAFEVLLEASPGAREAQAEGRLSALYLEQPFERQLALAKLISPNAGTLGTVLGPRSIQDQAALEQAASRLQLDLLVSILGPDANPIQQLSPVIASSDAFLAVPDSAVFNRRTARWILLMTLRQRIPLVAYSRRYVEAGAVAAVFSTTATVGREAAMRARHWLADGELAAPSHPELFEVSVNPTTARSLRLTLPPAQALADQLRRLAP